MYSFEILLKISLRYYNCARLYHFTFLISYCDRWWQGIKNFRESRRAEATCLLLDVVACISSVVVPLRTTTEEMPLEHAVLLVV